MAQRKKVNRYAENETSANTNGQLSSMAQPTEMTVSKGTILQSAMSWLVSLIGEYFSGMSLRRLRARKVLRSSVKTTASKMRDVYAKLPAYRVEAATDFCPPILKYFGDDCNT